MAQRIAVIGDVLLDKYDYCINRQNPESSAPCYTVSKSVYKPGGAGNLASNLASLGSKIDLFGIVGDDNNSKLLKEALESNGVNQKLLFNENNITILKERTVDINDGHYHFRKDYERRIFGSKEQYAELAQNLSNYELIVVSDYDKGTISREFAEKIKESGAVIIVDSKPNNFNFFNNVFLIKPNLKEARQFSGLAGYKEAGEFVRDKLNSRVLLTRGADGMSYFDIKKNAPIVDFKSVAKEVFDVTGAGDTVLAAFVHFFNKGHSIIDSIKYANRAAGIAVAHAGCYLATEKEIFRE